MALMPPYSTRFLSGIVKNSPATTISYTVPTGKVAIISCITYTDIAVTAGSAGVYIDPTGSDPPGYISSYNPISATLIETGLWVGHVVLEAGGLIVGSYIGTNTGTYVTVCGYLLTA